MMVDILGILGFLLWANMLPPLVSLLTGDRFGMPLDGGRQWFDHRPLLGNHKTVRGVLATLLGSPLAVPFLATGWRNCLVAAFLVVAGDLFTSFIKRRRGLASGEPVVGLDQFFEAALPAFYLARVMGLDWWQPLVAVLVFIPLAHQGAMFWKLLIYRPAMENYSRILRSTVRLKEWRACHEPVARYHVYLNFPDVLLHRVFLAPFFKLSGLHDRGVENALRPEVVARDLVLPDLPRNFDGFRILFLSDLHLDGIDGLLDVLVDRLEGLEYDLCLLGGDVRMELYGPMAPALRRLRQLLAHVNAAHGVLGVLGNHDCIEMVPDFEEAGVVMLVNDSWHIGRDGQDLWVVGVDDPHYYRVHNPRQAYRAVPPGAFSIFLAHSPEAYLEAAACGASLYLCGHTHGGQIRLPGRGPIMTNSRAPRFTAEGRWQHAAMQGFTSRGVGASGVPVRFNCPGEISVLTLRRQS